MKALPGTKDNFGYWEYSTDPRHRPVQRVTNVDPREQKPNSLCRDCNNVWMERYEKEVTEVLLSLAKGESRTISRDDQEILAKWAYIACIVRATVTQQKHISEEDRRLIRRENKIPEGYRFWLYQGVERHDWPTRFQWATDTEGRQGWVAWLWIGHAIIVVSSPLWADVFELTSGTIAPYRRHFYWDNDAIDWPLYPESFLEHEEFVRATTLRSL